VGSHRETTSPQHASTHQAAPSTRTPAHSTPWYTGWFPSASWVRPFRGQLSLVLMDSIAISPAGPLQARIRPPGSKSITNRALICAALAEGESLLTGALESEDTQVMINALLLLGIAVEADHAAATLRVSGCGGQVPRREPNLSLPTTGPTVPLLTAI